MYPGIAGLYAVFTNMLIGFFDLDLVQMCALLRHSFLSGRKDLNFWSSDDGHVTKGHNHSREPRPSLTMFLEVFILCCGSITYLAS
jgi:hypothetical protein